MNLEAGKTFARRHIERVGSGVPEADPAAETQRGTEPTLQEVIKERAFAEMLGAENDPSLLELGARVQGGEVTAEDMPVLAKWHAEYLDRTRRIESMEERFDERLPILREFSPELKALGRFTTEENFKRVLKQGFRELAFRNPAEFRRLDAKFNHVAVAEAAIDDPAHPANKVLSDFCAAHSIDEGAMAEALAIPDEHKRAWRIREMAREHMGFFEHIRDSLRYWRNLPSSYEEALGVGRGVSELEKARADIRKRLASAATTLKSLITRNDEMRLALMKTVTSEQPAFPKGIETKLGFDEAKEVEIVRIEPDAARAAFKEMLKERGITYDAYLSMTEAQKDRWRGRFWNGVSPISAAPASGGFAAIDPDSGYPGYRSTFGDVTAGKTGFWSDVVSFLAGRLRYKHPDLKRILG